MRGKTKCKILKEIRQKIAHENDIPYVTSECKYQGECKGTCPRCESELRYLERELEKRQALGKTVTLAGVAVTMAISLSSCDSFPRTTAGVMPMPDYSDSVTEMQQIDGEILPPESTFKKETAETVELMGDIPFPGEVARLVDFEELANMDAESIFRLFSGFTAEGIRSAYGDYLSSVHVSETTKYTSYTFASVSVLMLELSFDDEGSLIRVNIRTDKSEDAFETYYKFAGVPLLPESKE